MRDYVKKFIEGMPPKHRVKDVAEGLAKGLEDIGLEHDYIGKEYTGLFGADVNKIRVDNDGNIGFGTPDPGPPRICTTESQQKTSNE